MFAQRGEGRLWSRSFAMALALCSASVVAAAAQTNEEAAAATAAAPQFELELPVLYDGTPIAAMTARVATDGSFSADRDVVLKVLAEVLTDEALADTEAALQDFQTVTNVEAAQAGFTLTFDSQTVTMRLETSREARRLNDIALTNRRDQGAIFERSIAPEPVSAFFNVTGGLQLDTDDGAERTFSGVAGVDGAIRVADFVLQGSAFYDGTSDGLEVGQLRLIRDFIDFDVRATLGDVSTIGGGLTGTEQIIGLSLSHREGRFGRGSVVSSATTESFDIERSSNVEILVNGELRRRVRLAPGRYTLSDFDLISGANEILIVAVDSAGRRTETLITTFSDGALARPGSFTWDVAAGYVTETDLADIDFEFENEDLVFGGTAIYGLSEQVTLGASALVRESGQVGSLSIDTATPIGFFALDGAVSDADGGTGAAMNATFSPYLPASLARRGRSLAVSAFISTDGFDSIATDSDSEAQYRFAARYSDRVEIADTDVSTSLFGSYELSRDGEPDQYQIGGSLGFKIFEDISVRISPRYQRLIEGDDEFAASISLSRAFGRDVGATAFYDTEDNRAGVGASYVNGVNGVGALQASAGLVTSDENEPEANVSVSYAANRVTLAANHFQELSDDDTTSSGVGSVTNVTASTAIVFAGGKVAIGRPVGDSFAIVSPHPTLGDAEITLNPAQGIFEGYEARSDGFGPLVAGSIGSYGANRVIYAVDGAPLGYDVGSGSVDIAGPLNAGYVVEIGSERSVTAIGTLLTVTGAPVEFASGGVSSEDDLEFEVQRFFTNRAGRFVVQGLLPGRTYVLSLNGAEDLLFTTEPDSYELNRLGERRTNLP